MLEHRRPGEGRHELKDPDAALALITAMKRAMKSLIASQRHIHRAYPRPPEAEGATGIDKGRIY